MGFGVSDRFLLRFLQLPRQVQTGHEHVFACPVCTCLWVMFFGRSGRSPMTPEGTTLSEQDATDLGRLWMGIGHCEDSGFPHP